MIDFKKLLEEEERLKTEQPWLRYCWSKRSNADYPKDAVLCDRQTPWGNPFVVGIHGIQGECCTKFADWIHTGNSFGNKSATESRRQWILKHISELRGKNLLCWCRSQWRGKSCHTETLARLANTEERFFAEDVV